MADPVPPVGDHETLSANHENPFAGRGTQSAEPNPGPKPVTAPASGIICLGPGGVGKTSMSVALGVAHMREGRRVVVLTIDPARRLGDAMGHRGQLGHDPVLVEQSGSGELWAAMLDVEETFRDLVIGNAADEAQAHRIVTHPLFGNLTSALSGTGDYMATERLWELLNDDRFDLVVVDTPPAQHTVDILDAPGRLARFIAHPLYRLLAGGGPEMRGWIARPAAGAARLLGAVVGSELVTEVAGFLSLFSTIDAGVRQRALAVDGYLSGSQVDYVIVTAPRRQPIEETRWIVDQLGRRDRGVRAIIANRVMPPRWAVPAAVLAAAIDQGERPDSAIPGWLGICRANNHRIDIEQELLRDLAAAVGIDPTVVSERAMPVQDLSAIAELAGELRTLVRGSATE